MMWGVCYVWVWCIWKCVGCVVVVWRPEEKRKSTSVHLHVLSTVGILINTLICTGSFLREIIMSLNKTFFKKLLLT